MRKYVRNVRVKRKQGEVTEPGLNILQQAYSNSDPRGDTEYYRPILLLQEFTFYVGVKRGNLKPHPVFKHVRKFGKQF
jgi:hypothetical protein